MMEEETTFHLGSVPAFLRDTPLYFTFVEDQESESLTLPTKYCAFDIKAADTPDKLKSILSTLHFWGTNEIPDELFAFILKNDSASNAQVLNSLDNLNFKTIDVLSAVNTSVRSEEGEKSLLNVALRLDSVALVKFLEGRGLSPDTLLSRVCDAGKGSIECLTYIHSKGGKLDRAVVDAAVDNKSLTCLQYCMQNHCGVEITKYHLESAATNGDLPMLQYLRSKYGEWSDRVCSYAVQSKSLPCLQYVHANGARWNGRTFEIAVEGGSMDMVRYLYEHQCPPSDYLCAKAAAGGQLECLIYLKENGYVLSSYACQTAAQNGRLDCLKYALSQGCSVEQYAMQAAAANGHLHILQYCAELQLLERNASLCQTAASNNQMEVLKFLHELGCPLSADHVETTARHGNVKCMEYLFDQNCPGFKHAAMVAAQYNQLEILKLLHARGCRWDERDLRAAARHGHLQCLQYLMQQGGPWGKNVCLSAIYGDHFDCFKYVVLQGCPVDWEVEQAAERHENKAFINMLQSDYVVESVVQSVENTKGCKCVIC